MKYEYNIFLKNNTISGRFNLNFYSKIQIEQENRQNSKKTSVGLKRNSIEQKTHKNSTQIEIIIKLK